MRFGVCSPRFQASRVLAQIRTLLAEELEGKLLANRNSARRNRLGAGASALCRPGGGKKSCHRPFGAKRLLDLLRDWNARLADLLAERHNEARAMECCQRRWARRIPPEYGRCYAPELAAAELGWLDEAATRNQTTGTSPYGWLPADAESAGLGSQGERAVSRESYHRRSADAPSGRLSFRFAGTRGTSFAFG